MKQDHALRRTVDFNAEDAEEGRSEGQRFGRVEGVNCGTPAQRLVGENSQTTSGLPAIHSVPARRRAHNHLG